MSAIVPRLHTISFAFEKACYKVRNEGIRSLVKVICGTIRETMYANKRFVLFRVDSSKLLSDRVLPENMCVRSIDLSELYRLTDLCGTRRLSLFEERLANGRLCFGALSDNRVVGYSWLTDRFDLRLDGMELDVDPGSIYSYNQYVLPPFRGRGLNAAMYVCAGGYMREQGYKDMYVFMDSDNGPSLASLCRFHPELLEEIVYHIRLGRKTYDSVMVKAFIA